MVHKSELGYLVTFTAEGQGVRLLLKYYSAGAPGTVDFVLYAQVTNQTEPTDWAAWELIDGEKSTLAVRLSSNGGQSIEHGFAASFETSEGGVPIQPAP